MIAPDPITGGYVTTYQRVRDLVLLTQQIRRLQAYPPSRERDEAIAALAMVRRQREEGLAG